MSNSPSLVWLCDHVLCVQMPTLHRLSVFRDDLVFLVYIYQRWVYRVDKRRANEFGYGHCWSSDQDQGLRLIMQHAESSGAVLLYHHCSMVALPNDGGAK